MDLTPFQKVFTSTPHKTDVAVRFCLLWIALSDGDFHEKERIALQQLWGDHTSDVATALIERSVRDGPLSDAVFAFVHLRDQVEPGSRRFLMTLCLDMVLSDQRVSIGERHALCFMADLLGVPPGTLEAEFRERTGMSLLPIPDPSSVAWWNEQQRRSQQQHKTSGAGGQQSSGSQGQQRNREGAPGGGARPAADPRLVQALATLGLTHPSSRDEVKASYRRLAAVHHPDKYQHLGDSAVKTATQVFARIQGAYELAIAECAA